MLNTIQHQSSGDMVKVAQYLTGYAKRKEASGVFDANYVAYITSWQGKRDLTPDGIIGANTWRKIAEVSPTCSTGKNKTSEYTCALQILLGGLTADGIFGAKTKQAVAAYQSANGLKADGICGPKTWNMLIAGGNVASPDVPQNTGKTMNKCVHYLQWDSKWKNVKYSTHTSSQTIGNSGCGPTAMAQIMATFIDPKITPVEMSKLAVDNGYRTYDSGTAWGFYQFVFKKYNEFDKFIQTNSVETLKGALAQGALAVCSMNSNDNKFWTSGGLNKMASR